MHVAQSEKQSITNQNDKHSLPLRLAKLISGLFILSGIFCLFASGYTPPGVCGEVIRHNQTADIDATPLFYTEVENICEMIEDVEAMTRKGH